MKLQQHSRMNDTLLIMLYSPLIVERVMKCLLMVHFELRFLHAKVVSEFRGLSSPAKEIHSEHSFVTSIQSPSASGFSIYPVK